MVLKSSIPAYDEMGQMIKGAKIQLEQMNEQMQFATAVGAEFGAILSSAFTAAMNNGTSFFQELENAVKNYVQQLIAAVATTLALSAIVSAFTGAPLGRKL
jgi:cation transporter-like permease